MANPTLTYATLHEALSAITGYDVVGNSAGYLIKGQAGVQQITFNAGSQILKHANVTQVMVNANPGDVLGMAYNLEPQLLIQNPTAGAQYAAKRINLSPNMRAILSQSGHEVGSTALQPITKMEVIQSTGSNTLRTTSRGLLTKVPLKAVMRACAVAQGVMLGVDIVETNPEFCTIVSNKLFGTDHDPSEIASIVDNTTVWANIKDGAIFITEDVIKAIKEALFETGIYTAQNDNNFWLGNIDLNEGTGVKQGIAYFHWRYLRRQYEQIQTGSYYQKSTSGQLRYYDKYAKSAICFQSLSESDEFVIGVVKPVQGQATIINGVDAIQGGCNTEFYVVCKNNFKIKRSDAYSGNDYGTSSYPSNSPPADPAYPTSLSNAEMHTSQYGRFYYHRVWGISFTGTITDITESTFPFNTATVIEITKDNTLDQLGKWLYNNEGTVIVPGGSTVEVAGMKKIPNAVYPTSGGSVSTDYPDWWNNRTETIEGVDENDNITNVTWLPVDIFQPTGDDPADYSQTSTQAVTVLDDDQIPDIIPGIDYSIESDPDMDPDFDPYPQVYPQPNPQPNPGTDLEPFTPSTPTIDVSDGESPDPTIPILTTALTSGLAYVYNPTLAETKQLGRVLWTANFIENLKKIFVNPMDGIIGFLILYATPKTTTPEDIVLGYYNTHIKSKVVTNQYVSIDCGMVALNEYFKDARDYEPYTNVSLYLPFIGVVSLHADDVINSYVNIVYHVDVLTGTCLATVKIHKQGASAVVYQYPGNCSIQLPLSSGNYTNIITSVFSVGVSAVGGGALGAAKAVGRRAAGAIYGGMRAAAINSNQTNTQVIQSGCLGANAGAMGIRKPYFMIRRPVTSDAYAYNMQYGYPANKWVLLGGLSGFTRVKSVHLENIRCTDEEKGMIESALKEGVIF